MKYNLKPDEKATLELRVLYEKFGYKKYKIGKFEEYSLYAENSDFLAGDRVLTFTDLDGRLLAMKPDVTLSVINNTRATRDKSEKLYYIENVYRESKENHSFKEISQMGLEYMGDVTRHSILEVILLAAKSLRAIDSDYLLEISQMQYTKHLLDALDLSEAVYLEVLNNIRMKNSTGIAEAARRAKLDGKNTELLCQIPFLYGEMGRTIKKAKDMAITCEMQKDVEDLEQYCKALKSLGYSKNVQLDLSMVNDIDYYNGMIFRGYIRGLPGCVLAGGQYDKAMRLFGKDAGAIGFAVYLDELTKGQHEAARYDTDAVLLYNSEDSMVEVARAVSRLQKEGLSVRAETAIPECLRYREKYVMRNGEPVKEEV
ncbi:MAG: ATP phosphoribosyltransferase regulatory subunit [Bacillota bacterium]|nr:ATP phosphoribosyltransferase regulatory subunit [Bacillota bacterium]